MTKYKTILFITAIILITSCIEEYKPDLDNDDIGKYVVFGRVSNQEGYQTINISYSSDLEIIDKTPVRHCDVSITDDNGNSFELEEENDGEYRVWMWEEYLSPGTAYKVDILTSDGIRISSDYDTIPECADLDSVYYIREDIPTNNPDANIEGIQFYVDMSGTSEQSSYYWYEIEETWEYHTRYALTYIYDVGRILIGFDPPDSSMHVCWKTQLANGIFILSTENNSENKYAKLPLHYVKSTQEKLAYGYSLLVKQHALSESSYNYFYKLKNNIGDEEGLYNKQPEQIRGNLHNINNPNHEVLGYFSTTSFKSKRIFIEEVENLVLNYSDMCDESILLRGLRSVPRDLLPVYLRTPGGPWQDDACVDCRVRDGVLEKPDFWPI